MAERMFRDLARRAGLLLDWSDFAGRPQRVATETAQRILSAMGYPADTEREARDSAERLREERARSSSFVTATAGEPIEIVLNVPPRSIRAQLVAEDGAMADVALRPLGRGRGRLDAIAEPGYYRLGIGGGSMDIAVAPRGCVTARDRTGKRSWGLAAQIYSLRRKGDGGIGDTTAVSTLARVAAQEGADALALSPAHALFGADPTRFSPYAPSSRLFLNPLLADPAAVFGPDRVAAAVAAVAPDGGWTQLEDAALIHWPASGRAKLALLRRLFLDAAGLLQSGPLAEDSAAFCKARGDALTHHAGFEALHASRLAADKSDWRWQTWPPSLRDPRSAAVHDFMSENAEEVRFHMRLQWLADRAFAAACRDARAAGMRVGLIADLAIGIDAGGSEAWSCQSDILNGLSVGAPPDLYNAKGQSWGLTTYSPQALMRGGFAPFIATLRAAMRHAGGVRIDHVMGLTRLWIIPEGEPPTQGAYLAYPLDDMLRLIALESHRHGAIVIGEDLGTVPDGLRARLAASGIGGMQVLWFEREEDAFLPPAAWRADALAMTSTHDLPTVSGWWRGADIDARAALGQIDDDRAEHATRETDRVALWDAFVAAGIAASQPPPPPQDPGPAIDHAIAFIAQTPAALALVPVEDVLGLAEQPNIPGTTDEAPNWRRRMPGAVEDLLAADPVKARLAPLRMRSVA